MSFIWPGRKKVIIFISRWCFFCSHKILYLSKDIISKKSSSLKLVLRQDFVFLFLGVWKHSFKESEDHWTNETSEEEWWIILRKTSQEKYKINLIVQQISNMIRFHKFSQVVISVVLYNPIMVFLWFQFN